MHDQTLPHLHISSRFSSFLLLYRFGPQAARKWHKKDSVRQNPSFGYTEYLLYFLPAISAINATDLQRIVEML